MPTLEKKLLTFLLVPILFLMGLPGSVYAQAPGDPSNSIDWQEVKTENFIIVYAENVYVDDIPVACTCGVQEAEVYAAFVDEIYNDLTAVFEAELKTPINLRLFPTEESYYEVNPLAKRLTGVIAHALNNRAEIAIALPRTRSLTEEEIMNNLRHELTHFFASLLSDGKLKTGFHEGIAQYLEKPTSKSEYEPEVLRLAAEDKRLLTWAELDDAREVYQDPQVAYPEALSIVSFLIDRHGFPAFVDFLKATATEPGFRSALSAAYGKSADELESEWFAYLPEYLDGRWKINAIYSYDLSRVRELVDQGAYTSAESELVEIIALLETTSQAETLAEAESLLARAHQGQAAGALADEARQALLANNYPLAIEKGHSAIAAQEAVERRERVPEIQVYIHRAELGQQALEQLDRGQRLLDSFRFFEAENQIYEATVLLQSLDNQAAAQRGQELLNLSAQRQGLLAYVLLAVGVALLILNTLRRLINHFSAHPLEVEFT